jgi:integrase
VWRVLAETWIRIGELIDLRWDAVDYARGEIRVDRSIRAIPGGTTSAEGKTPAAKRTIPISTDLVAWLRRHEDGQRFRARQLGESWSGERYVFPSAIGTHLSSSQVNRNLASDCKRLGLPHITAHEIRHSGASHAHDAGVSPKTLSMRLGHADIATTLRIYSHPSADEHRKLSDRIGEMYG